MTGEQLKLILLKTGVQLKDLAEKMEMSQQNFSKSLKVSDIKTGFLEKLCLVLDKRIDFFYTGTNYAPLSISSPDNSFSNDGEINDLSGNVMGNSGSITNNYGSDFDGKNPSKVVSTLTESIETLTRELDTSQKQKSNLMEIIATSQMQITRLTELVDRLTNAD